MGTFCRNHQFTLLGIAYLHYCRSICIITIHNVSIAIVSVTKLPCIMWAQSDNRTRPTCWWKALMKGIPVVETVSGVGTKSTLWGRGCEAMPEGLKLEARRTEWRAPGSWRSGLPPLPTSQRVCERAVSFPSGIRGDAPADKNFFLAF